jgi:hypothetical protein
MKLLKPIILLLAGSIYVGSVYADPNIAAIQEQQAKRRQQHEIDRLAHEQALDRSLFQRELNRFDSQMNEARGRKGISEQRSLQQRLDQIEQQRERSLSHFEQTLRNLELNSRNDDRQRQELNRLRQRQQADAFRDRENLRLRQSRLTAHGRR